MRETLVSLAIFSISVFARNNTLVPPHPPCNTSTLDRLKSTVNSSAVVPIQHGNSSRPDWYLTVTLHDTRTADSADHKIWGFLSMPANTTGKGCVLAMPNLLPVQSGANGDCAGSLSAKCIQFLRERTVFTANNESAGLCPYPPNDDDAADACGDMTKQGWRGGGTGPELLSDTTCTDTQVLGLDQPPDGYATHRLFSINLFKDDDSDDKDPSEFTWYRRYKTQPLLWLVAYRDETGESWTDVVCVAPKSAAKSGSDIKETTANSSRMGRLLLLATSVLTGINLW